MPSTPTENFPVSITSQAALFVDFENLILGLADAGHSKPLDQSILLLKILHERLAQEKLVISFGFAYANWAFGELHKSLRVLDALGVHPQYVWGRRGRNTADLELSLDAQETLMTRSHITVFVIVGGDRDYLPIARRIRNAGKQVIIVSPSESMSDDLSLFIGPANFIDAAKLITLSPEEAETKETNARESLRALKKKIVPAPNLSMEERSIKLLLDVSERYSTSEIWLAPLLKNEAAEALPELKHEERKELMNRLKDLGAIRFEQRPDPLRQLNYTVILIERDHPMVKKLTADGGETANQ